MTISNTPRKAGPYSGNGAATTFAFAFKVFSAADVLVVRADTATGIETTLTLTTDYTVSLNADQDTSPGGTITTTVAPSTGQTITLSSDMDYTQPVELTNNGGFYPRVINDALDRLTIGQQQLKELTDRTLKVAVSTPSGVDTTLPAPEANKLIGWNPTADNLQNIDPTALATIVAFGTANADKFNGNGVTTQFSLSANPGALNNLDVSISGVTQTPGDDYTWTSGTTITFTSAPPAGTGNVLVRYMQGLPQGYTAADLVGYAPPGAGAVSTNVQTKLREFVSVKDFGAKGDGVTDDRAAIAAAVLAAKGKNVYFPEGQYLINTDGGSITLEEVGLIGEFVLDGATASVDEGSVLRFTGTTNAPFLVRRGVTIQSLGFFYPSQVDSASPVAYPPSLEFDFTNGPVQFVYIRDCVVYNAWRFIRINEATGAVGHVWIENNTICGILRAIDIRRNVEVIKIRGNTFTFGHWLAATEGGVRGYMRANAYAVKYDEGDGFWFTDNLIYGYLRGISITGGQSILTTIDGNSFDQVRYPIYAATPGNFQQSNISNNLFIAYNSQDTTQVSNAIYLNNTATADSLTITGNLFGTTTGSHIVADGTASGKLVIAGNTFEGMGHAQASGSYGALSLNCANKTIVFSSNYVQGQNNAYANGVNCFATNVLHVGSNVFNQCNIPLSVSTAGQVTSVGNASYSTVSATSDVFTSVTNEVWQTGNRWDKPSGSSTKPAFLARKNASQTFNSGTATDVAWGMEVFDKGSDFSTPSFTAPYKGRYRFSWALMHDNTGTAGDRWQILLTGTPGSFATSYKMIADYNTVTGDGMIELSAGDTVKLQIQRVSGSGNFVTFNDSNANFFCGEWIE